ncbi:MAG: ABC transporter permease [Nibricoccus sp.]
MRLLTTFIIAFRALRRNKLRTILAALGMIIGIGAVITMVSMGNGAKSQIESSIAGMGQNMITIFPGSLTTGGMRGGWGSASSLTVDDAEAIKREVVGAVGVSPEIRDRQQVLANGLNWNTQVLGESPDFLSIRAWKLSAGEFFTETDVRNTAKVCIIGKTVADQLFAGMDPIGQSIRARNIPLRVVGVLAAKGFNTNGQDQDDLIVVPYTTAMKRIARRDRISNIIVQSATPESMERVQRDIGDLLQQRRQGREPDYTIRNQLEIAELFTAQSKTMTSLLGGVALVSLIVGGIGIMNIMLVSVTERTREIGIRLAVGGHGQDIMLQFLTEAVVLSLAGGLVGIMLGVGASEFVSWKFGWPSELSTLWMGIAVGGSAVVGILSGFYPAFKASQLDPIDALRYE